MIHYNIWFNLQNNISETEILETFRSFLGDLYSAGEIAGFQLLRNSGADGQTEMLRFQALVEFRDDAQFSAAFAAQAARGIHTGLHGRIMASVSDFRIEVFRQIAASNPLAAVELPAEYGCEV
jgi:hypothetical protein